jgi:excisionase family DNA binding protein
MASRGKITPSGTSPVMTVAEVCAFLQIHRSTLYHLIKAGEIPFFRMGRAYRFTRQAIDEWRQVQGYSASPSRSKGQ